MNWCTSAPFSCAVSMLSRDQYAAFLKPLLSNDSAADVISRTLLRRCQPHWHPTKDHSPFYCSRGVIIIVSRVMPSISVCLGDFPSLLIAAYERIVCLCCCAFFTWIWITLLYKMCVTCMNPIWKSAYVAIVHVHTIYLTCHISAAPVCGTSKWVECLSALDRCLCLCAFVCVYVIKRSH